MKKHSTVSPSTAISTGKAADNRVRIIGGRWRGRKISFPDAEGLRPTGDRIRETLFNWLMPALPGARCLDLFAGSGVLGFEALSRGASSCVLIERNPEAVRHLQTSAQILGAENAAILCANACDMPQQISGLFDIVFMDPPFVDQSINVTNLLSDLQSRRLLAERAWVYVEQPRTRQTIVASGFTLHRAQHAGSVSYGLWRHDAQHG